MLRDKCPVEWRMRLTTQIRQQPRGHSDEPKGSTDDLLAQRIDEDDRGHRLRSHCLTPVSISRLAVRPPTREHPPSGRRTTLTAGELPLVKNVVGTEFHTR